jgi:hypothetical protein
MTKNKKPYLVELYDQNGLFLISESGKYNKTLPEFCSIQEIIKDVKEKSKQLIIINWAKYLKIVDNNGQIVRDTILIHDRF